MKLLKSILRKDITFFDFIFGAFSIAYIIFICWYLIALGYYFTTSLTGNELNLKDFVSIIASISTVAVFCFALYQYRENSIKEQQALYVVEMERILAKKISFSDSFVSEKELSIEAVNKFLVVSCNLAQDFENLYNFISNENLKMVLRIRWRDMYFNHFKKALDTITIQKISMYMKVGGEGMNPFSPESDNTKNNISKAFRNYAHHKEILSKNENLLGIVGRIESINIKQVKYYFCESEVVEDLMIGLLTRLDFRVSAPLLAALDEIKNN